MADEHLNQLEAGTTANLEAELANVPEKLRGKTSTDLINMYQELERDRSRLGNELGESRRTIDRLLEEQLSKPVEQKQETRPQITADDLLTDPSKTLDEAISTHPSVERVRQANEALERQIAQRTFESEYPAYREDLNDPSFVEWVKKNPARQKLILAANSFDLDSARSLWSMWSEHKELSTQAEQRNTAAAQRKQKEKDGTLEGSTGAQVNTDPRMNRAELRELHRKALLGDKAAIAKWSDPKFKQARLAAYAEDRVD
jgi:hypothetical protein